MDIKSLSLNIADEAHSPQPDVLSPGASATQMNPFVGLRPFDSTEGLLFFGRHEQTVELLQQLHRTRFLAVVGSSGCGKSSLIRAGLIPKLKAGFLVERRDQWRITTMKPGDAPLQNLACALLETFSEEPSLSNIEALVSAINISGLQAVVDHLASRLEKSDTNLLLLVDQFEEIFRFGLYAEEKEVTEETIDKERRRDEAADFVSIMLGLAQQQDLPIYVVMTMRSDFLGDCDAFYGLPEAMNRSQYLVPRLTRQQRQEAIENPIRLYGAAITPRLLDRVLNDVGEESDQLPVMQHALMRTWEKWQEEKKGLIDIEHYNEIGTFRDALSKDADKALDGLSPEDLIITERLFQALTDMDAKGRRLRRPAHLSEIEAITGANREKITGIIERFRTSNRSFLNLSEDRLKGDPLVDISHESLIRQWKTLREWVDAEAESREQFVRLASAAVRFKEGRDVLWTDPALQLALDWQEKRQPNEAWGRRYHPDFALAMEFLSKSKQQREADTAMVEQLRNQQAQREREELERAQKYAESQQLLAETLRQQAEDKAAARQRELEAAQDLAQQQYHAARRQRWFTYAVLLFALIAASGALVAVYALQKAKASEAQAQKNQRAADEAKTRAVSLATRLANSLDAEKSAKSEAEKQRATATENEGKALKAKKEAEDAQKTAEAATRRANEQARLAAQRAETEKIAKSKAIDEQRKADKAREEALRTHMADMTHRSAVKALEALKIEEAHETFKIAIANYEKIPDYDGVAHTYTELGNMLVNQDEEEVDPKGKISAEQFQALAYYTKAVAIYRQQNDFNGSAGALDKIGEFHRTHRRLTGVPGSDLSGEGKGGIERAVTNFCQALEDYQRAENLDGQISLLIKIGDILSGRASGFDWEDDGDDSNQGAETAGCKGEKGAAFSYYDRTIPLYQQMITEAEEAKELEKAQEAFVSSLIQFGAFYQTKMMKPKADEQFKLALDVYQNDIKKRVKTMLQIGSSLEEMELRDKFYQQAVQTYHQGGKYKEEADTLLEVADNYTNRAFRQRSGQEAPLYQKVLEYSNRAHVIYESLGDRKGSAESLYKIAIAQYYLKKYEESGQTLQSALALYNEQDVKEKAKTYYALGFVQENLNKLPEALAFFTLALAHYRQTDEKYMAQMAQSRIDAINRKLKTPPPKQP